jgi:hypothetical protein
MEVNSKWLDWTWSLDKLLNHLEEETIMASIQELPTENLWLFNADELFQQNTTLKDPLALHFTSLHDRDYLSGCGGYLLLLEEVLAMVLAPIFASSAPPPVFNRMAAPVMITLN